MLKCCVSVDLNSCWWTSITGWCYLFYAYVPCSCRPSASLVFPARLGCFFFFAFPFPNRQEEIHTAEPLVPEPSAFEVELAIEKLKTTNHQVLIKSQRKWLILHLHVIPDAIDKFYYTKYFLLRHLGLCFTLSRTKSGLCLTSGNRFSGLSVNMKVREICRSYKNR